MSKFTTLFNRVHAAAHASVHENQSQAPLKKDYSGPKIQDANGDLSKRWYVYFSYRNPETGKLERQTNLTGGANYFKTREERLAVLTGIYTILKKMLVAGFSPYEDNTERYQRFMGETVEPAKKKKSKSNKSKKAKKSKKKVKTVEERPVVVPVETMGETVTKAFNFALRMKQISVSEKSHNDYKSQVKVFSSWLRKNYKEVKYIKQVSRKVMMDFLNHIELTKSSRTRNNYRTNLGALFQLLENNELIDKNFVHDIPKIKTTPVRHKTYTEEELEKIFKYLEKEDPHLLLFIKFVCFGFLRPVEACRLRVKDVDMKNRTLTFKAKNSPLKTKIIPEILYNEIPDLSGYDPEVFLFTHEGIAPSETSDVERRVYYTKMFNKKVKKPFKLNPNHGVYSFRHTFITKIYREIRKSASPFEAKSHLMLITGHTSMEALNKYLRDIDAELPEDYSHLFEKS
ncbi:site-specific integrase [Mangrovimonas sp. CR14]|uniref:tyrosine-type recombinase/integrase n=1 Tax=Mangrovimonas sp. CR14 TaxID=2706120 RepID=UPI00141D784A|nr:site-specific integrase [Mangrovimonas sp. CR14]NIK93078.1 site-specific integrase [Mangrovimonas sp. CR14]